MGKGVGCSTKRTDALCDWIFFRAGAGGRVGAARVRALAPPHRPHARRHTLSPVVSRHAVQLKCAFIAVEMRLNRVQTGSFCTLVGPIGPGRRAISLERGGACSMEGREERERRASSRGAGKTGNPGGANNRRKTIPPERKGPQELRNHTQGPDPYLPTACTFLRTRYDVSTVLTWLIVVPLPWVVGYCAVPSLVLTCSAAGYQVGPLTVYDTSAGWGPQRSTMWTDYYQTHDRDVTKTDRAPWGGRVRCAELTWFGCVLCRVSESAAVRVAVCVLLCACCCVRVAITIQGYHRWCCPLLLSVMMMMSRSARSGRLLSQSSLIREAKPRGNCTEAGLCLVRQHAVEQQKRRGIGRLLS
eukprot:1822043-Rhodomonas_salina.1